MGACTPNIWESRKSDNLSRFRTTLEFDREYLQNGSRYRRADTSVVNYDPFHVRRKKWVNFGPLTRKFTRVMITHPKWTQRVLCRLMQHFFNTADSTSSNDQTRHHRTRKDDSIKCVYYQTDIWPVHGNQIHLTSARQPNQPDEQPGLKESTGRGNRPSQSTLVVQWTATPSSFKGKKNKARK